MGSILKKRILGWHSYLMLNFTKGSPAGSPHSINLFNKYFTNISSFHSILHVNWGAQRPILTNIIGAEHLLLRPAAGIKEGRKPLVLD